MKVYFVEMLRWGDHNNHSYPVGVFSTADIASEAADRERSHRGGKYEPAIYEFDLADALPENEDALIRQSMRVLAEPARCYSVPKKNPLTEIRVGDIVAIPAGGWVQGKVKEIDDISTSYWDNALATVDVGEMVVDADNLDVLYREEEHNRLLFPDLPVNRSK